MKSEDIKDLRLMIDMLYKDLSRLATDVKALGDCLQPLYVDLMLKEGKDAIIFKEMEPIQR